MDKRRLTKTFMHICTIPYLVSITAPAACLRIGRRPTNLNNMQKTSPFTTVLGCLLALLLGYPTGSHAQWTDDTAQNTPLSNLTAPDLKILPGPDGSTYIAYWHERPAPQNYELRLQKIDSAGIVQFGQTGLLIDASTPMSTFLVTWDMKADRAGNIYIGITGTGSGNPAVVHKISPQAEQPWGPTGINIGSGYDLKLLPLSNGEVIVSYLPGSQAHLRKLTADGQQAWAAPLVIAPVGNGRTLGGELVEISGGRFELIFYVQPSFSPYGPAYAQCYNFDGQPQWPAPVPLSQGRSLRTNARYAVSQSADTTYFGFSASQGLIIQSYIQRINPDGSTPWGNTGLDFADQSALYERDLRIAIEQGSPYLWAVAEMTPSSQGSVGEWVQKIALSSGQRLLGADGREVFAVTSNRAHKGELRVIDDRPVFLINDGISNGSNPLPILLVSLDTAGLLDPAAGLLPVATQPQGIKDRMQLRDITTNGYAIAVWTENRGSGSLPYAQRIRVVDEIVSALQLPLPAALLHTWPVPCRDQLFVRLPDTARAPFQCQLLDAAGRRLQQYTGIFPDGSQQLTLSLQGLPSGIYFLLVEGVGYSRVVLVGE